MMSYSEYDSEHFQELQEAFDLAFENLADSFLNGDIAQIISRTFEFAAKNPLCTAFIAGVFVVFGFHIFAFVSRSFRRG